MAASPRVKFPPYLHQTETCDASDLIHAITAAESTTDGYNYPTSSGQQPQRLSNLPRYLVGVSSKAYFTHAQTISYAQKVLALPPTEATHLRLFFIPSFPGVSTTSLLIQQRFAQPQDVGRSPPMNLLLGAQDCHFGPSGAHTGSVPASELAELGCTLVELGHAERRRAPLNESDAMTAAKARMAVAAGLVPLVCIGERNRAANPSEAMSEIRPQIESVLKAIGDESHIVLGYEPVWAIGQQEPAPKDYVCAVADSIRELTKARKGDVRILYGGSAKPGIWPELKQSLDGLFLGRFAHDVEALKQILKEMGA